MRILALEPYYGGSHRAFLDGWRRFSAHDFTILGLPPHAWKWRMRHAAVTFAEQVRQRVATGELWDVVVCSDMLNLAEFRGLCPSEVAALPTVVYFHENQLTYPVRVEAERDLHFAYTNFTTCLAANAVWFNSEFHRDEFLGALTKFLRRMPDFQAVERVAEIAAKSSIHPPGVDAFPIREAHPPGPLRLLWAARWEHDKNPADFFAALKLLLAQGVDFRVSVIGEQFRDAPAVFAEYREKLAGRIDRWGFQASRDDYRQALLEADVFVSTSNHEFFGIAAVEAMAAGCRPLLPQRLAYPELLRDAAHADEYFYDGTVEDLARQLRRISAAGVQPDSLTAAVKRFRWQRCTPIMDAAIIAVGSNAAAANATIAVAPERGRNK